jgi:hypothetical protein
MGLEGIVFIAGEKWLVVDQVTLISIESLLAGG